MTHAALIVLRRSAVILSCTAAMVLTGCGDDVSGQGSLGTEPDATAGKPYVGAEPGGGTPVEGVAPPPAGAVVDYQIGGSYPPASDVDVVIRDRSDQPADGVYSICYVNAFQAQPHEASVWEERHPDLILRSGDGVGDAVEDEDWGEPFLDISTNAKRARLVEIVDGWLAGCAERGFRAVEPDNLDSWTRSSGLLNRDDAVEYARLVVERAHARGLAVAQKNAAELTDDEIRRIGFDFAIAEDCQRYSWGRLSECDRYLSVYGDRVIEIEYTDGSGEFNAACRARGDRISILLRDRDVVPRGETGYVSRHC
ncbi:endo alpha-1,4 polygalactosaminidase [Dietzia maris]